MNQQGDCTKKQKGDLPGKAALSAYAHFLSIGHALVWRELPPPPTFSRGFAQSSSEPGTSYTARDAKARRSFWCQSLPSILPGKDIRGWHSVSNTLWLAS